ncbi:hypothetical protein C7Y69_21240 [Alteromonas sp. KS69]|nr:hypothetical protein C7Y69_21240 [Alteromonas sp. KS69]
MLKYTPSGRWDAYTRGGFAIMPHVSAPLSLKLYLFGVLFVVKSTIQQKRNIPQSFGYIFFQAGTIRSN